MRASCASIVGLSALTESPKITKCLTAYINEPLDINIEPQHGGLDWRRTFPCIRRGAA